MVRTLLEWVVELLSKTWSGWRMGDGVNSIHWIPLRLFMTTRAPAVLRKGNAAWEKLNKLVRAEEKLSSNVGREWKKVETEATLRILLFVYNFWSWMKGESWQICLVSTDMVQIFAAKVIQGMKMLQMCQRQEATGFQKQEIKAQCETRIFNKLLPEILFSRPGLYCTLNLFFIFEQKMDINVVSLCWILSVQLQPSHSYH